MENQNQNKLYYLKNHQYNLENFKEILQEKEFNIYEFVSVFNPLINTILTSILLYTDNLRIIAILVTSFNILIALYLSVHKYYLSNEIPLEKRILIHNSNSILGNLRRLDELYQTKGEYNLEDFQQDLYQDCLNTETEMNKYITPKKLEKLIRRRNENVQVI